MANTNMKQAQKIVTELELQAQLIPSATNPLNCVYILVNGQKIKSSQLNGKQLREVLESVKCGNKVEDERKETTKANIKELIPFNCSINETLKQYIILQANSELNILDNWLNSVIDFYCIDDNDSYNTNKIKDAESMIASLIATGKVIVYKDTVFTKTGIQEVINEWLRYNNKEVSMTNSIYNRFIEFLK